jgi:hypothetical protein
VVSVTPRPRFTSRGKDTPVPIVQVLATELVWTQRLEEKSFAFADCSGMSRLICLHVYNLHVLGEGGAICSKIYIEVLRAPGP